MKFTHKILAVTAVLVAVLGYATTADAIAADSPVATYFDHCYSTSSYSNAFGVPSGQVHSTGHDGTYECANQSVKIAYTTAGVVHTTCVHWDAPPWNVDSTRGAVGPAGSTAFAVSWVQASHVPFGATTYKKVTISAFLTNAQIDPATGPEC